jgi:hypothetical protein
MIINIRGTHGSGKSTIIQHILAKYHATPCESRPSVRGPRPLAYNFILTRLPRRPVFIIGPYETACGGCDAIQPYDLIWPLVEKYGALGHVLFEGALVSSSVGNIGRAMAERDDCVVTFLNTPLQVCLDRIAKRRRARGDDRPLNPHNTTVKFEGILRSRPKMEALGLRCIDLDYRHATDEVLTLLGAK